MDSRKFVQDARDAWSKGRNEEALQIAADVVASDPRNAEAAFLAGVYCQSMGQLDRSQEYLLASIRLSPTIAAPYWALSKQLSLRSHVALVDWLIDIANTSASDSMNRITALFALAKAHHDDAMYEESSNYLLEANNSKLRVRPSDCERIIQISQRNLRDGLSEVRDSCRPMSDTAATPIFLVGLPRSGSTLLEQLLIRSGCVHGMGESDLLQKAVTSGAGASLKEKCRNLGRNYLGLLPRQGDFTHYTDKALYNYTMLPQICQYISGARVLHCRRDPMDLILSMYQAHFQNGNAYCSSLRDSARVYLEKEQVLNACISAFPGSIMTVQYEDLVSETEGTLSQVLEFCGLPPTNVSNDTNNADQPILTSSLVQARMPIYRTSVRTSENYRSLLRPAEEVLLGVSDYRL